MSEPIRRGGSIIGFAQEAGHTGSWHRNGSRPGIEAEHLGPKEATWRPVIGQAEAEGRFALRKGGFIELSGVAIQDRVCPVHR